MKRPEISVIVPVYNVEKYLRNCLNTILNQTFANIEIICVNDGSEDKSRQILEEYKNRDSRIKIVDKENGGLSSARNAGMKVATGDYYAFIDSDDWIDKTMFEKMYKNITELNSDIAICAVNLFDDSKSQIIEADEYFSLKFFDESFDNRAFSYKDTKPFLMDVCVMAWNKLYKRSFIEKCQAKFPDGLIFEDGPFFFSIFFKTQRVSIVREFLYFYRINRIGSIVQKGGRQFLDIVDVVNLMYEKIKDIPDYEDVKYIFFKKKVEDFISRLDNINPKYKREYVEKIRKESILTDYEKFPPTMAKGRFLYNYTLFDALVKGGNINYLKTKYTIKSMYKMMEFLYHIEGYYTLKYHDKIIKIKKNPKIFDIYYLNDKIYISILKKIKFNFTFRYSELERFHHDE